MTPRTRCRDACSASLRRPRVPIGTAGLATAALLLLPALALELADPSRDRGGVGVVKVAPRALPEPAISTRVAPVPVAAGQEAVVEIPSLHISLPVVRGGQPVIDEGVAAHYSTTLRPVVDAGQPGTYWLAAHSGTHGSPFGQLPAIANGAKVRIKTLSGMSFTYTVTSRDLVGGRATYATVYGPDTATARILLQTCQGSQRLLVHGVLISEVVAIAD
jgi:LPXTG-site transpeptidase (sortase) family protein